MRIHLALILALLAACHVEETPTTAPTAMDSAPDGGAMTTDWPPPVIPKAVDPTKVPPLPADQGKPPKLAIVAIKVSIQKGLLRDTTIELKTDASLWFDGKKLGKISDNKAILTERPKETTARSDGYLEQTGEGYGKGFHMKMSDDTLTSYDNATTQLKADGTIVATLQGLPPQQIGAVTGDLKTPEARRTALVMIGVELARPPSW